MHRANKTIVKSAKFLLAPNGYKTGLAEIDIEDQGNNLIINQAINKNEKLDEFVKYFPGVTKYIEHNFSILKEEEVEQNKGTNKKKKPFGLVNLTYYLVIAIMFILFFIFSFLAVVEIKDPYRNFIDHTIIKTIFMKDTTTNDITTDILNRLENILYKEDEYSWFKLVSMGRFSFYQSNDKECNDEFGGLSKCYNPYYKNEKKDNFYDTNFDTEFGNITNYINASDYFVYSSSNNDTHDFINGNATLMKNFLSDVFRGFQMENYEVEGTSIKGTYGTYKGENCVDLFIPISLIKKKTLEFILNFLKCLDSNYLNFSEEGKKAIVIDFTLYSPISQMYYYIYLVYENSVSVEKTKPEISIIPFYPDLKKTNNGKAIYVLDILRLIFIIVLFIIRVKEIYSEIMKNINLEKNHQLARSIPSIIFSADFILDLGLCIIKPIDFP